MNILLVVHGYPPEKTGGTETYTRNLARALAKDHRVAVFTRTESPGKEYETVRRRDDGIEVMSVRNTYSMHSDYELHYRNPHIEPAFASAMDEFEPDVVHFTYLLGGLSASFLEMAAERRVRTALTLTDFHYICAWGQLLTPDGDDCPGPEEGLRCSICFSGEDPYAGLNRLQRFIARRRPAEKHVDRLKAPGLVRMRERIRYLRGVLSRADKVIAPTKYLRDVYMKWGVSSAWIPFAIDKSLFDGFSRKPSDVLRFGFIGRLLPLKGLHVLVEAFSRLSPNAGAWRLYVYADDSGDEEKKYLSNVMKGAPKGVEFRGTFPVEKIRSIYEDMDVLTLPSLWAENSPMALLFALHTGTPVVAADIGGVRDVASSDGAFYYPPRDPEALRGVIEEIVRDRKTLDKLTPVKVPGMEEHARTLTEVYLGGLH